MTTIESTKSAEVYQDTESGTYTIYAFDSEDIIYVGTYADAEKAAGDYLSIIHGTDPSDWESTGDASAYDEDARYMIAYSVAPIEEPDELTTAADAYGIDVRGIEDAAGFLAAAESISGRC